MPKREKPVRIKRLPRLIKRQECLPCNMMEFTADLNTYGERVTHDALIRIADQCGMPTEDRKVRSNTSVFHPNFHFHVFPCSVRKNVTIVRVFYHSGLDLKKTAQVFEDVLRATGGRWLLVGKWTWVPSSDI
jgi:hypothetical protein